ncbi:MAG: hypothetical protein ACREAB_07205 [Blastocatellia bacterium]
MNTTTRLTGSTGERWQTTDETERGDLRPGNKKAIPDRGGFLSDIEYCAGWDDHANMGVACLCAYDFANELPLVYRGDNLHTFYGPISRAEYLIGFNNARFDNRVLEANGIKVPDSKTIDLLAEIWKACGLDPDNFEPATHGGYGLDAVCAANFGAGKTGNGAIAPVEWQRGQIGKVVSYCLSDVQLTFRLWRKMANVGEIINPKTEKPLKISLPQFDKVTDVV